ncbi:hypothetical protein BTO30_12460 [Domibacillus antri]|uniref:HK97 gp10 family phage protein n=1 Tax=Domibacillus antri TaxID=1714264 RepID=A0A1Q8Q3I8_9BACI|nr:HK97 gp10 family phage protein [Domibacillus antri]OLN21904.1 hypothetical protein BTO30_12460 [Domibacillus antri]
MVKIGDLSNEIAKQLSRYTKDVEDAVEVAKEEVAKNAVAELKEKSPKLTGRYAKGWALKKVDGRHVIYNRTDGQLTHLLEFGHVKAGGGRVPARVHIRPAEEKAINEFVDRVEKAIRS